jgi:hypothetical protein
MSCFGCWKIKLVTGRDAAPRIPRSCQSLRMPEKSEGLLAPGPGQAMAAIFLHSSAQRLQAAAHC